MYGRNDFLLNSSYIKTRAFQNKIHFETVFVYSKKNTRNVQHYMYLVYSYIEFDSDKALILNTSLNTFH